MRLGVRFACSRVVAAVLFLGGLSQRADAGQYSWSTSGPESGTIRQVLVDSQNTNRLLAAAGYYGPFLFATNDRGTHWTYQGDPIGFGRIVPDPARAGFLYAPTYGGVLKSTDGGGTWTLSSSGLPSNAPFSAVAVAPSSPDVLYTVTQTNPAKVYRSLDAGDSWALVSSSLASNYVADLVCDASDPSVLYAAADTDIVKSVDGGATFTGAGLNRSVHRILIDARLPGVVYAGTNDAGVFASPDAGATWNAANAGIATQIVFDLALDPSNLLRLWAALDGGLYVTQDGGQSWSPVDLGVPVNVATAVAVDPSDASRIYVGAGTGILRGKVYASADGGSSWNPVDKGLSGFYSYAVASHPSQGATAYGVSGSRVYRTNDAGGDWTLQGTASFALTALLVDPTVPDTLYAGYASPPGGSGVLKSVDGGANWNPATAGLSVSILNRLAIARSAPDRLLAASFDGLFGTLDGGGLWSPLLSGDVLAAVVDPADVSILYAGLANVGPSGFGLLRSSDGGATWAAPAGIPAGYLHYNDFAIPVADPFRVYAATSTGVFRSQDRGASFSPANTGLFPMPGIAPFRLASDPTNAGTLYLLAGLGSSAAAPEAGAFSYNVFRTTNGADAWAPLPGFLPAFFGPLDLAVDANGRTLYAATINGVFQFSRSFLDVPDADPFWSSVDVAAMNGVTSGCGGGNFCPGAPTSRASVAVFLLRGKNGAAYAPPAATGAVFWDVPAGSTAAGFIEELFHQGVTAGCGGGGYCPASALTRAQIAVLLLRMEHGAGYAPPPATGTVFADVPADAFAAAWIERLSAEGVTAGCGGGNFCPGAAVIRAQAAALVARAFGLS